MGDVINLVEQPAPKSTTPVHVMVDTETLGLDSNAIILSIGAVVFDFEKDLGDEFYVEIDPSKYPGAVDISTIQFWMGQVASGNPCPINGKNDLGQALTAFVAYLGKVSDDDLSRIVLWANGTDFDIPKLAYAFKVCQAPTPWGYNAVRDARTVYKTFAAYGTKPEKAAQHNALADAKWQAEYLVSIMRDLHARL